MHGLRSASFLSCMTILGFSELILHLVEQLNPFSLYNI